MLRLVGVLLLVAGSTGVGWKLRERLKWRLKSLYAVRQIFGMLQNEIAYSRSSLPEACRRIGNSVEEPFAGAFLAIHGEMVSNSGVPFSFSWKKHMEECLGQLPLSEEEKRVFVDFGNCIGYTDGRMQAEAIEQYVHRINLSVAELEKDMANKVRMIMSLSVMGGLLLAILLI